MSSLKGGLEPFEHFSVLTATCLHQKVQETQEAYFDLERSMESCLSSIQEAIEQYEDGEDVSLIMGTLKHLLEVN